MKTKTSQTAIAVMLACASISTAQAEILYGLSQNTLFSFDSSSPGSINGVVPVSGLQGESLLGLDFRPRGGALYGLGSSQRLYTIDPISGAASLVNSAPFAASTGGSFGFDFNPVPDALRIVSNTAENFRVSPTGSLLGADRTLAYNVGDSNFGLDPVVVAGAYANNFDGATSTTLFGIDASRDTLLRVTPPNDGVLNTVGLLGFNTTVNTAFDISGVSGRAYASLTAPGAARSGLFEINLQNGSATFVGDIGFNGPVSGLAAAVPEPGTWALIGLGLTAFLGRAFLRRR